MQCMQNEARITDLIGIHYSFFSVFLLLFYWSPHFLPIEQPSFLNKGKATGGIFH